MFTILYSPPTSPIHITVHTEYTNNCRCRVQADVHTEWGVVGWVVVPSRTFIHLTPPSLYSPNKAFCQPTVLLNYRLNTLIIQIIFSLVTPTSRHFDAF